MGMASLEQRLLRSLSLSLLLDTSTQSPVHVAVPLVQTGTVAERYAHAALLLLLSHSLSHTHSHTDSNNNHAQPTAAITLIEYANQTDAQLVDLAASLKLSNVFKRNAPAPTPTLSSPSQFSVLNSRKQPFASDPLLRDIALAARTLKINTLALPTSINNLVDLALRFPRIQPFPNNVSTFLSSTAYSPFRSTALSEVLRNAKLRNSGVWGSRDPSAFAVDVVRPLLPFTNAELRDFCHDHGYVIKSPTQTTVFVNQPTTLSNQSESILSPSNSDSVEPISTPSDITKPVPDLTFANRHDLAKELITCLARRETCKGVIDLSSEFDTSPNAPPLDISNVFDRIIQRYEAIDDQANQILATQSVRDPPTGTCFLTIPTTPTSGPQSTPTSTSPPTLIPPTHWLHNRPLAHTLLRNLLEWTAGTPSAATSSKLEMVRVYMLDYYTACSRAALIHGHSTTRARRRAAGAEDGLSVQARRILAGIQKKDVARLATADVQIIPPPVFMKEVAVAGSGRTVGGGGVGGGEKSWAVDSSVPWMFARASFSSGAEKQGKVVLRVGEVGCWDNRFYVNIGRASEPADGEVGLLEGLDIRELRFSVRAFTLQDYHRLLNRIHHGIGDFGNSFKEVETVKQKLSHYMRAMPTGARNTIPCVALVQDNGDDGYVLSIPSLGILTEKGVVDVKLSFWGEAWKGIRAARKEVSFVAI